MIAFLEDRRVLYDPCQMEVHDDCVRSVIEIRDGLTEELGKLEGSTEQSASLRAMCAACRKFLERVGADGSEGICYASGGGVPSWTFGVHVAKFKLDVEDKLASILISNADVTPVTMTVSSVACTSEWTF